MVSIPIFKQPKKSHGPAGRLPAVAAAALVLFLLIVPAAVGQDQVPSVLPINPVPDIELVRYDAFGYLDEIRDDAVIVDDTHYPWSTEEPVRFFTEGSSVPTVKSLFKAGDLVGVVYDDFGSAKELWKLKAVPVQD